MLHAPGYHRVDFVSVQTLWVPRPARMCASPFSAILGNCLLRSLLGHHINLQLNNHLDCSAPSFLEMSHEIHTGTHTACQPQ